ncbi:hypothetical protein GLYMA_03G036700v4 [Glycine max]|nr:hypothetical protein GLYMA_03G036700v4 [Glycine max]
MALSPETFTTRKRRPRGSSFTSPKVNDLNVLSSLLQLTDQICSLNLTATLLNRVSSSTIRKTQLLGVVFEELFRVSNLNSDSVLFLCLEEMYIVLHKLKTLIQDFSNGSKFNLLMQIDTVAESFHRLTGELSTLLDVKQCSEAKAFIGAEHVSLRNDVVLVLDRIKNEIVPDQAHLASIFEKLEIRDASSCRAEIESLEEEIHNRCEEQPKTDLVALIGLVRFAKCVLYGASTPSQKTVTLRRNQSSELAIPADYRCPISLELMRDPVVVATGQTYDRVSIKLWMDSGHNTCPKTGQTLSHSDLIPNRVLRNMITAWCREQRIPFEAETDTGKLNGGVTNKAALEATRMTVSFLINKLKGRENDNVNVPLSVEDTNGVVYELRVLAKTDSDSRACIAEAGAIPVLVRFLNAENPSLQVNAVTTILNMSILEANKTKIMETDGALNGIAEVLISGATWEAKANAAATVFSLSGVAAHRKKLGRKTRVVSGLVGLAKSGPEGARRDALAAILNLAADRETVARLVEGGVVGIAAEVMAAMPEEGVTILEAVVKRGGLVASAAATLVTMCRKGGSEVVAEMAAVPGVERIIWELMAVGSVRGRRKAATLLRILRRWAAGLDGGENEGFPTTTTMVASSTTTVVVPTTTTTTSLAQ